MMSGDVLIKRFAPFLACLGLLFAWQVFSLALRNDSFPTALEAIRAIPSILGDKEALVNILASLRRMAVGFGLAVAASIPLGLLMGRSRAVASFFNPLLMVIYPVPKAALMPIIMLWLGVGDVAKTLVIFLGVSLPVIYHSFEGAKSVEEKMLWSGAAMGLTAERLRHGCRVVPGAGITSHAMRAIRKSPSLMPTERPSSSATGSDLRLMRLYISGGWGGARSTTTVFHESPMNTGG